MVVEAVIRIEQIEAPDGLGRVRDYAAGASNVGGVRDSIWADSGYLMLTHLPHVSNPEARNIAGGRITEDPDTWSDRPERRPNLLYRYRFGWGRDRRELFDMGYDGSTLGVGSAGARWGKLDDNSGEVVSQRVYALSSTGVVRQFEHRASGKISNMSTFVDNEYEHLHQFGGVDGDADIYEYPFLLLASPEPHSRKNPVDSDVYIRLSNYNYPLSSGTINLYIDGVWKEDLHIESYFGGLGGFDVTWYNDVLFDYDARVHVRWEFSDTDSPVNDFVIEYPFYTVPDYAKPRISGLVPAHEATGVSISGFVLFELDDYEHTVDIGTLRLYVNNVLAVDGDNGTIEVTPNGTETGYTIVFTPNEPWLYGDLIPVAIFVSDTSPQKNELFYAYSFTTEESVPPRLLNIRPAPCAVDVPVGTDISVDIVDGGHGLAKDSIIMTIEDVYRNTVKLFPIVHRDD